MGKLRLFALAVLTCVSLTACKAETVNTVINTGAEKAGVSISANVTQEQIDNIQQKVSENATRISEGVQNAVEDERTQEVIHFIQQKVDEQNK